MSVELKHDEILLEGISQKNFDRLQATIRRVRNELNPYLKQGLLNKEDHLNILRTLAELIYQVWERDDNSNDFKNALFFYQKVFAMLKKSARDAKLEKKKKISNNLRVVLLRHSYEKLRNEEQAKSQGIEAPKPKLKIPFQLII